MLTSFLLHGIRLSDRFFRSARARINSHLSQVRPVPYMERGLDLFFHDSESGLIILCNVPVGRSNLCELVRTLLTCMSNPFESACYRKYRMQPVDFMIPAVSGVKRHGPCRPQVK